VSLPDINDLYFNAILHGIRGSCNVTLIAGFSVLGPGLWADLLSRSTTSSLSQGEILNLTLSTPIALLKTFSPAWLLRASMTIMISGASSAQVVIKETSIKAVSGQPLYPVTIDAVATTGESLYNSYLTRYLSNPPAIILNRTGETQSPVILLQRANYTVFLPKGEYSSLVGWYDYSELHPVIDGQEVAFNVTPSDMLHLQLKMRTYRLDIAANPPIPFYSFEIWDANGNFLLDSSTRYSPWPEHLYLPPIDIGIRITLVFDSWYLRTQTSLLEGHIHRLSFSSPLTIDIFGFVLNLGQLLDIGLVALIFVLIMKRWFVLTAQLNRRAVVSDDRFVPLILLVSSFLCPWISYSDYSVYRFYYFAALPIGAVTFQGNSAFASVTLEASVFIGMLALVLLWVPFIVLLFLLPTPQSKSSYGRTGIPLLLPFLYGLFYLAGVLISGITLEIGTIFAVLGLPLWLLQKLIRHKIGFSNIHLSYRKTGRGS
jgi:hypothetical protein